MKSIDLHLTKITTNQEWASSPNMIEVTLTPDMLAQLHVAMEFLEKTKMLAVEVGYVDFQTYQFAENEIVDLVGTDNQKYAFMDPEFTIGHAVLRLTDSGEMKIFLVGKHCDDFFETQSTLDEVNKLIEMQSE